MDAILCQHYHITGVVQGVCFRAFTHKQAKQLQLTGWVRNCDDGSVEAIACGTEKQLVQFTQILHQGPSAAVVNNVIVSSAEKKLSFTDFRCLR